MRFIISMEKPCELFRPYVLALCLFSVFYGSFMAVSQEDMKRTIAYSSVAHMNFALLGLFSNTYYGYMGALCMFVSHGIISPALFLSIGVVYDRYYDRNVQRYGGLITVMPMFITGVFLFMISNFSFPLTSNFIGEVLILIGLALSIHNVLFLIAAVGTYFAIIYSMLLFNKLSFGTVKVPGVEEEEIGADGSIEWVVKTRFKDLERSEAYIFYVLICVNLIFGIVPTIFLMYLFLSAWD